jgi:3-oxoacid CoA-transferase B subunit
MKERLSEDVIAMRVVKALNDGDYVNLGFGIPLKCALFIPPGKEIYFQAEQGVVGYTRTLMQDEWGTADLDYVDAGGRFIPPTTPGMSVFGIDISFAMIVGGHLDCSVMGALEISEKGDLANWTPGSTEIGGIGGSMDLAVGAKRVIIAMTHTTKQNKPKIVKRCNLPLTAEACVDLIVTDIAVIEVIPRGLVLKEVAPGWSPEEVQGLTEPGLILSPDLKEIEL